MSSKYTLMTAVLMTMAALAWGFNLVISIRGEGFPLASFFVFIGFSALAAAYWIMYRHAKSKTTSDTE